MEKMRDMELLEIKTICDWFVENKFLIIQSASNSNNERNKAFEYLDLYKSTYATVFNNFYKGKIRFEYAYDHKIGKFILDLCHLNKKSLIKITSLIKDILSQELGDMWIINLTK